MAALTLARLRSELDYDPQTGAFTLKHFRKGCPDRNPGDRAENRIKSGYVVRISGVPHTAARLAWLWIHGEWPKRPVRHANGDPFDNRADNLVEMPKPKRRTPRRPIVGFATLPDVEAAAYVRSILRYNPETGVFIRRDGKNKGKRAGSIKQGYLWIQIERKTYAGARLAWLYMTGKWPTVVVDHIDRDPTNNRWANLREADFKQNAGNASLFSTNKSGVRGVHWAKKEKCWVAMITIDNKRFYLGRFKTKEEAAAVYAQAAREKWGDYAPPGLAPAPQESADEPSILQAALDRAARNRRRRSLYS
jgi:HNH endonuclease/AP2 domain